MYFYEDLYLNDNRMALETIEDLRLKTNVIKEKEELLYKDAFYLYDKYLDNVCEFLKSLDLKNSLELAITLGYLISGNYLSYNNEFKVKKPDNKIYVRPGINIVNGEGYDDEMSGFFKDISDKLDIYNKRFYCYQSLINNYDIGFDKRANHVNNLINYNDNLYGYDIFNSNQLYSFTSDNRLESLNKNYINKFLTYKPYIELINDESDVYDIKRMYERIKTECNKDKINVAYFDNIKYDLYYWYDENNKLFLEFSKNNNDIKGNIQELLLK